MEKWARAWQHREPRDGVKAMIARRPAVEGPDLGDERAEMKELLRTNDMVKLSWLTALLSDAGIEALILDSHTSVLEGSALAIPRRLAVVDDDYQRARRILTEAGEELPE